MGVRKSAKQEGLNTYFTGNACPRGHVSERRTHNGECVDCHRTYQKRFSSENPEYKRRWNLENRDPRLECLAVKIWYDNNKDIVRFTHKRYNQANKGIVNQLTAKYRARKRKAMPSWVDVEELKRIYINCPSGYDVDHIVPLKNDIVCGLHVPWNLQYLPESENCRKHNKFVQGAL